MLLKHLARLTVHLIASIASLHSSLKRQQIRLWQTSKNFEKSPKNINFSTEYKLFHNTSIYKDPLYQFSKMYLLVPLHLIFPLIF